MKNFSLTIALVTLIALYDFGTNAFAAEQVSYEPATVSVKASKGATGAKKAKTGDVKTGGHKLQMKHPAVKEGWSHAKANFEKHMANRGPRISVNGIMDSRYRFRSDQKVYDVARSRGYDYNPTSVVNNQYDYLKDWGFQTDAVLNVRVENRNIYLDGVSYGADVQLGVVSAPRDTFLVLTVPITVGQASLSVTTGEL